ncbi:DUF1059 domain-containing protein [Saccharopolyspora rectivirgula]|uniref:DUF1059 domain-containing protein n=1 Tax=Saccharopolyspora rectivirgula TaxID=28042 RepID=A0A073AXA0_9PSEU|nr:DUF1059 domain-containing protein [Saccharopolyspora rectivirgula]KEI43667.1 hypothetical protein GU90_15165 [Saccharopolyspora rectivirgula]
MARKAVDCRRTPSAMNCTLRISGEEEEVVRAAAEHMVSVHGHEDSAQLRQDVRRDLVDESTADGMHFVQLIEFRTKRRSELDELMDEWERTTGGKRTAVRAVITHDHEDPDIFYEFVEFPSYEEAMRNSRLPETDAVARKMAALCESPPVFHNLDVDRVQAL